MIEYIKNRITRLKKEIARRNKFHRDEAISLKIVPLSNNGWHDTVELEGKLKILKELYAFEEKSE